MRIKVKKITIAVAALAIFTCIIGSTLAWLTDTADAINNTFTVGDIKIELSENGFEQNVKLYPGAEIAKSPIVTVKAKSENCYVYAMVENNLIVTKDNETKSCGVDINGAWELVEIPSGINMPVNIKVYRYKVDNDNVVKYKDADEELLPIFTKVKVPEEFGKTEMDSLRQIDGLSIKVAAYAHQAEKQTQVDAVTAAIAYFKKLSVKA